jgi:hypothetical protein
VAIPIIIGGAAVFAGLFGAKKGLDAKNNYAKAKEVVGNAVQDFEEAQALLERQKEETSAALKALGATRLTAEGKQLKQFVTVIKPVHHVTQAPVQIGQIQIQIDGPAIEAMTLRSYEAADLLKDGLSAVSSGVLTGLGATGLASSIGVASTGTAIGGLSGAAATNATLAWLGGGSLATGGLGVAGGTAVLGGAIAGPVIAVMGIAAAKKSETALTQAFEKESEIRESAEQVRNGAAVLTQIAVRANEINHSIMAVNKRLDLVLAAASKVIQRKQQELSAFARSTAEAQDAYAKKNFLSRWFNALLGRTPDFSFADPLDFNHFDEQDKSLYMTLTSIAYALNALIRVQVLNEEGSLVDDGKKAISDANNILEQVA